MSKINSLECRSWLNGQIKRILTSFGIIWSVINKIVLYSYYSYSDNAIKWSKNENPIVEEGKDKGTDDGRINDGKPERYIFYNIFYIINQPYIIIIISYVLIPNGCFFVILCPRLYTSFIFIICLLFCIVFIYIFIFIVRYL